MGIIIGLDIGGSTTKIVGFNGSEIINPVFVRADNPVASLFGALGEFVYNNHLEMQDIEKIMITGVGSANVEKPLYGIPTACVDEFCANGLAGRYFGGEGDLVVVSMGTGTSLVRVVGDTFTHLGGIGIGGGTLIGLSSLLLHTEDVHKITELGAKGDVSQIDLQIGDISKVPLPNLPLDATASNFGKVRGSVSPEDVAAGLLHMVYQTIGKAAVLSAEGSDIRRFVAIGNLAQLPQCRPTFDEIEQLFGVEFMIPKEAEFGTAIGAALAFGRAENYRDI